MAYENRKVSTDDLEIGMYVSDLDRAWDDMPFPLQGFIIKTREEIATLRKHCKYVYIDRRLQTSYDSHDKSTGSLNFNPGDISANERLPLPERKKTYADTSTAEDELETAKGNRENLISRFRSLFRPFKSVEDLEVKQLEAPITNMIESIIRNPDAHLRLTVLKEKDDYTYGHCINMGILAVTFGRHLGLAREDLNTLAWGAIFCDFGKAMLPEELLRKVGRLSEEEFEQVKSHVSYSVEAVQAMGDIPAKALEMIRSHHERFNGSGYPQGLQGREIPIFSRMAGIVDTYDAIINDRPYARAISPHLAMRELYELRDIAFQTELVEAFVQAIGVYPVGTLVELDTGQVGVVINQNRVRHLKPKIMLILDEDKVAYKISPILDLFSEPLNKSGKPYAITNVLEPHAYGIKPEEVYSLK